jgi:hypothetical protein
MLSDTPLCTRRAIKVYVFVFPLSAVGVMAALRLALYKPRLNIFDIFLSGSSLLQELVFITSTLLDSVRLSGVECCHKGQGYCHYVRQLHAVDCWL